MPVGPLVDPARRSTARSARRWSAALERTERSTWSSSLGLSGRLRGGEVINLFVCAPASICRGRQIGASCSVAQRRAWVLGRADAGARIYRAAQVGRYHLPADDLPPAQLFKALQRGAARYRRQVDGTA